MMSQEDLEDIACVKAVWATLFNLLPPQSINTRKWVDGRSSVNIALEVDQ